MINDVISDDSQRVKSINKVTLQGSLVNMILVLLKFAAGILGNSAAMIADAVHSLSDFLTDIVVLLFVRLGNKPKDKDHDYGHGKYETLATTIIGITLLVVGLMICFKGLQNIIRSLNGESISQPGIIALIAAIVSILLKEWTYRFTIKVGKRINSSTVIANAWHHRSDALSSIGTMLGIGGAILLGKNWAVLDPIAAVIVSILIIHTSITLLKQSMGELLEKSLPDEVEDSIVKIAEDEEGVSEVHNLRTRRIGNNIAIEMHVRMSGDISLYEAHRHATNIESKLRDKFGNNTHIGLHVEPKKVNGEYKNPSDFIERT